MTDDGYSPPGEQELAELYFDAFELADKLRSDSVKTDCIVRLVNAEVLPRSLRARLFGTPSEKRDNYVQAWNLHGCEPAGIESMALGEDGVIYIDSAFPMAGGDDQMPVMAHGVALDDVHFGTFARVAEVQERLDTLVPAHA